MAAVASVQPKEVKRGDAKRITAVKIGPCSVYCTCVPKSNDSLNANEFVINDRVKMLVHGSAKQFKAASGAADFPPSQQGAEGVGAVPALERLDVVSDQMLDPSPNRNWQEDLMLSGPRRLAEDVAADVASGAAAAVEELCEFVGRALREGRVVEAHRALTALESRGLETLINEKDVAKVRFVHDKFEASLKEELLSIESLERDMEESGSSEWVLPYVEGQTPLQSLAYRYCDDEGTAQIICEARCPELDPLKAFANVVEYDLTAAINHVSSASVIHASRGPVDSLWHAFKDVSQPRAPASASTEERADVPPTTSGASTECSASRSQGSCFRRLGAAMRRLCGGSAPSLQRGASAQSERDDLLPRSAQGPLRRTLTTLRAMPEDNIMRVMAVDALETHGCLWAAIRAQGDEETELDGFALPPTKAEHVRNPYRRSAWLFKPLRDDKGKVRFGCEVSIFFAINPFDKAKVDKIEASIVKILVELEAAIASSPALDDRIKNSQKRSFYSQVRRHLEGRNELFLPKTRVGELPPLRRSFDGSPAADSVLGRQGSSARTPLRQGSRTPFSEETPKPSGFEDPSRASSPNTWRHTATIHT